MCLGLSSSMWARAREQMDAKGIMLEDINKPNTVEPERVSNDGAVWGTVYSVGLTVEGRDDGWTFVVLSFRGVFDEFDEFDEFEPIENPAVGVDPAADDGDLTEYVNMDLEPIEAPSVFISGFHDKIQVPEVTGREVSSLGLMSPAVKPVASRDSPHRYRGPARFA